MKKYGDDFNLTKDTQELFDAMDAGKKIEFITCLYQNEADQEYTLKGFEADEYTPGIGVTRNPDGTSNNHDFVNGFCDEVVTNSPVAREKNESVPAFYMTWVQKFKI